MKYFMAHELTTVAKWAVNNLDGELFLFRVANPKGDVPSNLGF